VAPRRPDCSFASLQTNCCEPVVPGGDDRPDLVLGDGTVLDRVTDYIDGCTGRVCGRDGPATPRPAGEGREDRGPCDRGDGIEEIEGECLDHSPLPDPTTCPSRIT